jgi:hypothetical protein
MSEMIDPAKCNECQHWKPMDDPARGYCRRYPPAHDPNVKDGASWLWPITSAIDSCGEWVKRV